MRFYYISLFSLILLGLIYVFGTMFLVWLGKKLKSRWDGAWKVMAPLFLLLYIGPIAEELWIAWNFGQLCKKDAGIYVHQTVEVDGFYDDTTHWWRQLAESDYQFVESRDNTFGGLYRVERDGAELKHFEIQQLTARYRYSQPDSGTPIAHKVERIERAVTDNRSGDVLAKETKYRRRSPWFFIGLDRPVILCPAAGEHPLASHGSIYDLALKPRKSGR